MFLPLLIEITTNEIWAFFVAFCAFVLVLGTLAVAIENIRSKWLMPTYNFWIAPIVVRRRRNNELHAKFDAMNEMVIRIDHEINTNSGSSLKDSVNRIEKGQDYFHSKLRHNDQISAECLFEIDDKQNVTFVNHALCELLDVESTALLNRAWLSRLDPACRERVKNEWRDSYENKMPFDSRQNIIDPQNGELFEVRVKALPHLDCKGSLIGFFGHVTLTK